MASASVICTNKTRTITQNEMTVVAGTVGVQAKVARRLEENRKWAGNDDGIGLKMKDLVDLADSVRKFLQFQTSAEVTVIVTTFVWALASSSKESPLSTVQLLWANLIMDTFAALAFATDPASPVQFQRKPDKKTDPLFTINMIKQILGQAIYQITVILVFHFLGPQILGFHHTDDPTLQKHDHDIVRTLVFDAFMFAQIFNSFNCRRLDSKLNVFDGVTKNWHLMAVTAIGSSQFLRLCGVVNVFHQRLPYRG